MRRPTPPSRLARAWLALGVVALALVGWRFWPGADAPAGDTVALALPEAPETLAPSAGPNGGPNVTPDGEPNAAPAPVPGLPEVTRAAPESDDRARSGAADEPSGVRITLSGSQPNVARVPASVPPAAPDPSLTTRTAAGLRPHRAADGRTPFTAYRRQQPLGDEPAVAVLLGGLGFDEELTRRAVALPDAVSLSFVPYARDVEAQMARARAAGHEVLVELPMAQAGASADVLGPAALSPARGAGGNDTRLDWLLSRSDAYPMVTNYLGGEVTADTPLAGQLMDRLARAGLAYVDDTGELAGAARVAGVPYAAVDVLAGPGDASAALRRAASTAAPGDVRLVKLYASAEALAALEAWSGTAALAPASSKVMAP